MSRDERQWKIKGSIANLEPNFSAVLSSFVLGPLTALNNEDKQFFLMMVCVHACECAEI
jgi:hypothetical protein